MKLKLFDPLRCGLIALVAVAGTAGGAWAAVKWGCYKYANYSIKFYNGASGDYYTAFQQEAKLDSTAISPWTDVYLSQVSSHGATDHINCYSGFYGTTGWAGLASLVKLNGCIILDGHAQINRTYADAYSMTWKKHIACHELGHLLGLAHTSSTSSCLGPNWNSHTLDSSEKALVNSLY
jgi:hypothetical protein